MAHGYTKDFFDVGCTSDHDIAIVSRSLFEMAREIGVKLRQGGTRSDVLSPGAMKELHLTSLRQRVYAQTKRKKTRLIIYEFTPTVFLR